MEPYYQDEYTTIYHGDCREMLPSVRPESVDLVLTDPPYGIRKAAWDESFPTYWLEDCARIARRAIGVMPGINNVVSMPQTIPPFEYRWMLSIHLSNGMTRGLMGFGNWIPVVVYGREGVSLYRPQQDAVSCAVSGVMPDHPSPKPLKAMTWAVDRFEGDSVLDPFMGSGTTLLAAKQLGRKAIGIELDERYCYIAAERLAGERSLLGDLQPPPPAQETLALETA